MMLLSIGEAAKLKGVSISTIRRWEASGIIKCERTPGGHRRYEVADLLGTQRDNNLTVAYARCSSHEQKEDLKRQIMVLEAPQCCSWMELRDN